MRLEVDQSAIDALATDPRVLGSVGEDNTVGGVAQGVADEIEERAPTDTGSGARSIHAEAAPDPAEGFRVGWDVEHFYLSFAELGTEDQPARPFARPVADEINRRKS